MPSEEFTLTALDQRPLAATVHAPLGTPAAAVVVLGALGVPHRFYARLAAWLAERDVAVLTFDYRGVARSRAASIRKDPATLLDWAQLDASAAIDAAHDRWPGVPLWGLGHSFGGQALGLTPRALDLAGAIVVAAGSGDLSLYPAGQRQRLKVRLGLATTVVSTLLGYVPGRLGIGEDLPAGVVRQWAQWCDTPDYVRGALGLGATHYHRVDAPMWFYDFTDDTYAPAGPSAALRAWFSRAKVTHRTIAPADLGLQKLGHFGPFRAGAAERLWDELLGVITGDVRPVVSAGRYANASERAGARS
jgi:predicted alpha/beta hydrolase